MKQLCDQAYDLLSGYHVTAPLDICTDCCMTPAAAALLSRMPVRDIPRDLLAAYNDGASSAKTPVHEIKHFLPRYLELISGFEFPTHSPEIAFRRLYPFDPSEWTAAELRLLQDFSTAFFRHCLSMYPLPRLTGRMDSILIMFEKDPFEVPRMLSIWLNTPHVEALLHFKDLVLHSFDDYYKGKLGNPFSGSTFEGLLKQWADSGETRAHFSRRIETLMMDENMLNEKALNELSLLYEVISTPYP